MLTAKRQRISWRFIGILSAVLLLVTISYFTIISKLTPPNTAPSSTQYDVIVVGAGPGGIAASLQAARMGERVALLEPTDRIGGQITEGVGTMDEGSITTRKYGVYKEFVDEVTSYYRAQHKSTDTCYYGTSSLCVDPKSAQEIFKTMLGRESSHLHLQTDAPVTQVLKTGDTVNGVVAGGQRFTSHVVIDAEEYGDLLDQAGANYRIGNGTCTEPNVKACIQSITYVGIIKKYPNGVPDDLTFTKAPPGYNSAIAAHFAKFVTPNGNDHAVKPAYPFNFSSYLAFRGLPDLANPDDYDVMQKNGHTITRSALIAGNDYPYQGVLSSRFLSDQNYRQDQICKAKLLTLQLVYYIQHDLGEHDWSLADDEGYDTSYDHENHCANFKGFENFEKQFPVAPYVREGKRMIGTDTLTGNQLQYAWKDKTQAPHFANSIAVGYYPMDLHDCRADDTLELQFDSQQDWSGKYAGGAFEVPMGVLVPESIDGLLAAEKNISTSRLAGGATREQPITMSIGQAAGALAALAAQHNVQPRTVNASEVQTVLRQTNAQISFPKTK